MFGKCFCNPSTDPEKFDKRLSHCKGVDRTCAVHEPDMSSKAYWNLATDPDKSGGLRNSEGARHVRARVGHVRFCLLEFG
jgi:hypothetical protein